MSAIQPIISCTAVPDVAYRDFVGTRIEYMLITEWYDGATSGFIQCSAVSPIYHFVTLDWSQSHAIRIIALSVVPSDSMTRLISFFPETPPRGQWMPKILQRASEQDLDRIDDSGRPGEAQLTPVRPAKRSVSGAEAGILVSRRT